MVINRGRQIKRLVGIQGVQAGGTALWNGSTNVRFHRINVMTTAVNYTAPTIALVGAGTYNATLTAIVALGVITAVAITAAGSGMTNGTYTSALGGVKITDATGVGAQLSVTVAAGAVSAVAIVSGGTAGPCSPAFLLGKVQLVVNGVTVRDLTAAQYLALAAAHGEELDYGVLPILFTEPRRNFLRDNELTSWDMANQTSFAIQFAINGGVSSPGIAGSVEFDGKRNARIIGGKLTPFLAPLAYRSFGVNLIAGDNPITTIPRVNPISRMWILGSTPGNISELNIKQDGNIITEGSVLNTAELYRAMGFQVTDVFTAPVASGGYGNGSPGNTGVVTGTSVQPAAAKEIAKTPWVAANGIYPFDAAFIGDVDGRPWKALNVDSDLEVNIKSLIQQSATIVVETLPGNYASA